jgi:hypothetical protein
MGLLASTSIRGRVRADMRHRHQSKSGEYLYKRALFKVIVGQKVFKIPFVAEAGKGYSAENLAECEERVVNHIDKSFSRLEFRRVQIEANQVNFIACGTRPPLGGENGLTPAGDGQSPKEVLPGNSNG